MFRQDPHLGGHNQRYCDVKTININDYSPGKALNLGAKYATKKYILNLSSHCVITAFDKNVVNQLYQNMRLVLVSKFPAQGKRITPRYIWSHYTDTETVNMYSSLEGRYFFHNAFSLFKEFIEQYPFDEALVSKEDRYWANSLVKDGFSFVYTNRLAVHHHYTLNGNTWKALPKITLNIFLIV